jgi:DNA-binding beta-propeller fold protein YncE
MRHTTFLLLGMLAFAVQAADPATLQLNQTIPLPGVEGRFDHFAIDAKGHRLFVAALGNNTLEVIDLVTGKRLESLPGMSKPTGVLYLPEPNQIVVANGDDGTLKFIDGSGYKVLQNVARLEDADNLRLDPKTKLVWLGYGDGALGIIDAAAAREIASLTLPKHPESFQLEMDGNRIFVNVPDAKQVSVIDREQRTVIKSWPMEQFQANFSMALDEPNHRLFIGCRKPARLVVLDTATGKRVADLAISGDTDDLFYDVVRKRLYVSCGEGFIDTIEQTTPDSYKTISHLATAAGARTSFYTPELDCLYLAVPARGPKNAEIRVYLPQM